MPQPCELVPGPQDRDGYVIQVEELVRKYGSLVAVDHVSFQVRRGEIFGFLGPNGAGKTTTINVLCTLLKPTGGRAQVNGYDVVRHPDAVRQSIGLVFQDPSLDDRLTAWENLKFHAMLYDVPDTLFRQRAPEVLDLVELTPFARKEVRTFSGGMKRRLEIARGLVHCPHVLFLDEPTLGLDPQSRRHIWDYILAMRAQSGLTIFLTTHYMDEAEHADRVAIMDHGKIVALDTPANLKGLVGGDVVLLRTSDDSRAAERLQASFRVSPQVSPEGLRLEVDQGDQFIPQAIAALTNSTGPLVEVHSASVNRPTLEDVFIKLTGRAIRDEELDAAGQMRQHGRMRRRAGMGGH